MQHEDELRKTGRSLASDPRNFQAVAVVLADLVTWMRRGDGFWVAVLPSMLVGGLPGHHP